MPILASNSTERCSKMQKNLLKQIDVLSAEGYFIIDIRAQIRDFELPTIRFMEFEGYHIVVKRDTFEKMYESALLATFVLFHRIPLAEEYELYLSKEELFNAHPELLKDYLSTI